MAGPFVVFGYGSLIFKPPPHVISQVPGYLKGYVRRFAQRSPDHRGTEESPGRVVTLIHQEDWHEFSPSDPFPDSDVVWGVALTIDPAYAAEVRELLDIREAAGYTLEEIDVYGVGPGGEEVVVIHKAQVYVGRKDNPSFVANESLEDIAAVIWRSIGPSGPNKDYLYHLGAAIQDLAPESHDSHLLALEEVGQRTPPKLSWEGWCIGRGISYPQPYDNERTVRTVNLGRLLGPQHMTDNTLP